MFHKSRFMSTEMFNVTKSCFSTNVLGNGDFQAPSSPVSVMNVTESIDKVKIEENERKERRMSSYKPSSPQIIPTLNRVRSEERQRVLREKKLKEKRERKKRCVRFSEDTKTHDGLEPQNLVVNTLVWECFNMRLRCVGDVLKKIQPKHLHLLSGAYERLSELCRLSKQYPSQRFKILPRGGGKQLEIKFEHHYRHLRALREIVRKTHNRLHIAANAALQAKKKGNDATAFVLQHMEWQEEIERERRAKKRLAEEKQRQEQEEEEDAMDVSEEVYSSPRCTTVH